jgi:hypothetical protein
MIDENSTSQLKQILDQSNSMVVVLGPKANLDQVASAVALFRGLRNSGKEVILVSPEEIELDQVLGLDDVKYKLGNKDLSVSFDYDENLVDKVSYHIDEEKKKFYLVVKPKKGHKPLDSNKVSFDYVGAQADLIFLVGVHQYSALEHLYENYIDVYDSATVITIHNFEPEIGNLKLDISGKSCWSEAMFNLLEGLDFSLDDESATNLLTSIDKATKRLTSFSANADTFEIVAKLMRLGAKRLPPKEEKIVQPAVTVSRNEPMMVENKPLREEEPLEVKNNRLVEPKPDFVESEIVEPEVMESEAIERKSTEIDLSVVSEKLKTERSKKDSSNKDLAEKMKDKSFMPDNLVRRV